MHMIEIWGHKLVRMITLLSHSAPIDNETVLRLRNPRKRLIVHHIVPLSTEQWFTTRATINTSNLTVPNPISRSCSTKSAILRLSLPCLNGRISVVPTSSLLADSSKHSQILVWSSRIHYKSLRSNSSSSSRSHRSSNFHLATTSLDDSAKRATST